MEELDLRWNKNLNLSFEQIPDLSKKHNNKDIYLRNHQEIHNLKRNFDKLNKNKKNYNLLFSNLNLLNWPWKYKKMPDGEWIQFPCD